MCLRYSFASLSILLKKNVSFKNVTFKRYCRLFVRCVGHRFVMHHCASACMFVVFVSAVPKKLVLRVESIDWSQATVGWRVMGDGGSVITCFSFYYVIYNTSSSAHPVTFNVSAGEVHKPVKSLLALPCLLKLWLFVFCVCTVDLYIILSFLVNNNYFIWQSSIYFYGY